MTARLESIQAGWGAYDRSGRRFGDIDEVESTYVHTSKGLIFVHDIYIPMSAITRVDPTEGAVYVDVDEDQIEEMGWDSPPVDGSTRFESVNDGAVVGSSADTTLGSDLSRDDQLVGDAHRVPLHQEELVAQRRQQQAGEVDVRKRVVEESEAIDVPLTHEEVQVTRRAVDRPASGDQDAFSDGETFRIPVTAETVDVDRQSRVVEEIEISKRPVTETQRVEGTVRREEVDVDATGDAAIRERSR
jgi:uncharacterized protein (TIGR02271 family)